MTHLKSKEDIAWLFEVHLPHVSPFPEYEKATKDLNLGNYSQLR